MPVVIARLTVRDLLKKRYLVSYKGGNSYLEATGVQLSSDRLSFDYEYLQDQKRITSSASILFKKIDYLKIQPWNDDGGAFFYVYSGNWWNYQFEPLLFAWKNKRDAEQFWRAFNRVLYEAWHESPSPDDLSAFTVSAKAWRSNPASVPKPSGDWDKYRILAEQNIKDKNFIAAVKNYEESVAAYPPWAEGWFNAALIYEQLEEYGSAANRMKHYLELAPGAPDAKTAREKLIIWEDKAKN